MPESTPSETGRQRIARRRRAARLVWRRIRWPVLITGALVALVLGYIGLVDYLPPKGHGFGDVLYRALQLFTLEGTIENPPVELQIARFLAFVVASVAIAEAIAAVFREQVESVRARLSRRHVVIAGLGFKGERVARMLREQGERVVAIDHEPDEARLGRMREMGVIVVRADAADPAVLRRAGLKRASLLYVTCSGDGENLDVWFAAAEIARRRQQQLPVRLHLDDLGLWRALVVRRLEIRGESLWTEFFNVFDQAARLVIDTHPPFADANGAQRHVAIVGTGRLVPSLVMHIARAARAEGVDARATLTLVAPDAPERVELLLNDYPALSAWLELDAVRANAGAFGTTPGPGALSELLDVSTLYIDALDDPGAAAAVTLAGPSEGRRTVLVVADDSEGTARALRLVGAEQTAVVGAMRAVLAPAMADDYFVEALAQAVHVRYQTAQLERGDTPAENESLVPWADLPESLRESNRAFARSVRAKLQGAGGEVVSAPLDEHPAWVFSDDASDDMARDEHERWCRDQIAAGWEPTDGPKDPVAKKHPRLVGWDELDDVDKDKDRANVAAIPELLAAVAGLQVFPGAAGDAGALVPAEDRGAPAAAHMRRQ